MKKNNPQKIIFIFNKNILTVVLYEMHIILRIMFLEMDVSKEKLRYDLLERKNNNNKLRRDMHKQDHQEIFLFVMLLIEENVEFVMV